LRLGCFPGFRVFWVFRGFSSGTDRIMAGQNHKRQKGLSRKRVILVDTSVIVAWLAPTHSQHQLCAASLGRGSAQEEIAVSNVTYAELAAGGRTRSPSCESEIREREGPNTGEAGGTFNIQRSTSNRTRQAAPTRFSQTRSFKSTFWRNSALSSVCGGWLGLTGKRRLNEVPLPSSLRASIWPP